MVLMAVNMDWLKDEEGGASSLIRLLQKAQEVYGYLPKDVLQEISKRLNIPLTRIYGVATFYAQFRFTPVGKYLLKICHGTACHVNGAVNISQAIKEELGAEEGQTTEDGLVTLEKVACLGCCSLSPVIMVNGIAYGKLTPDKARKLVKKIKMGELE